MSGLPFEEDAARDLGGVEGLPRVGRLARLLVEQQAAVAEAEEKLAAAKAALLLTERVDLPELMKELGLQEVKLEDGSKVTVTPDVICAIAEAKRADAFAWLEERGYGGLIKTEVSVSFGRDELEKAEEVASVLSEVAERPSAIERTVHPQTLKAFVKERMAAAELDARAMELFGVQPFDRAKLTAPKIDLNKLKKGKK